MGDEKMTLEEKVAKLETELGLVKGASTTGVPVVPPKVLPLLLAVYGSLLAVTAGLAGVLGPNHTAVVVLGIVAAALAPILGIVSPGLRKVVMVAFMLVPLALSGCVHLKPGAEAKLISCGTDAMQAEVASVMPAVADALQGTTVDWQHQLDGVIAKAGSAALCALAVLVANLEVGGGGGEPAQQVSRVVLQSRLPTSVLLTRAYSYQANHPFHSK